MYINNMNYRKPVSTNWKDALSEFKAEFAKGLQYENLLTPMEKITLGEYLVDLKEQTRAKVIPGAVNEFNLAKANYVMRDGMVRGAKARAEARFDSAQLAGAASMAKMRIETVLRSNKDNNTKRAEIAALFNEAKSSQDLTKIRGTAEALVNITNNISGDPMEKMAFNRFSQDAEKVLREINTTPEIIQAEQNKQAAANELAQTRDQMDEIANLFHGGNAHAAWEKDFVNACKGVDFGIEQGQVVVTVQDNPGS